MDTPLLECGHNAMGRGTTPDMQYVCVICYPDPRSYTVVENPPDLTGRRARCTYYGKTKHKNECRECIGKINCECERDSDPSRLPFFTYRGPGSRRQRCGNCGLDRYIHNKDEYPRSRACHNWTDGPDFDEFYCGCHSWN